MRELSIKAVPTRYNGMQFRSKLEARWACHLDHMGVDWQYEPATYKLPSGEFYLPDFWIPYWGFWLEVKGPGIPGLDKSWELAQASEKFVVVGQPPSRGNLSWYLMDPPEKHIGTWAVRREETATLIGESAELTSRDLAIPFPVDVPAGRIW